MTEDSTSALSDSQVVGVVYSMYTTRGRAQSPKTPVQTPVQIGGFHCTAQRHFNFENPWSTGGQEPVWSGLFHSFEKGRLVGFLPASLEQS